MDLSVFQTIQVLGYSWSTGNRASRWIRDLWSKGVSIILAYFETFLTFCVLDDFFSFVFLIGFRVLLVHHIVVSVLLSASALSPVCGFFLKVFMTPSCTYTLTCTRPTQHAPQAISTNLEHQRSARFSTGRCLQLQKLTHSYEVNI